MAGLTSGDCPVDQTNGMIEGQQDCNVTPGATRGRADVPPTATSLPPIAIGRHDGGLAVGVSAGPQAPALASAETHGSSRLLEARERPEPRRHNNGHPTSPPGYVPTRFPQTSAAKTAPRSTRATIPRTRWPGRPWGHNLAPVQRMILRRFATTAQLRRDARNVR